MVSTAPLSAVSAKRLLKEKVSMSVATSVNGPECQFSRLQQYFRLLGISGLVEIAQEISAHDPIRLSWIFHINHIAMTACPADDASNG